MLVRVRRPRAVELLANGAIYFLETVSVGRCEWVVGKPSASAHPPHGFGSMPMRSLTAARIRCLQPK